MKNIKWFFSELIKIWSEEPSYFSKKRIESSLAFLTVIGTFIWYIAKNINVITPYEFTLLASALLVSAGYTVNSIQKEKRLKNDKFSKDL